MGEGFAVDLDALRRAADGVTDTLDAMATKKVSDIDAAKSAFGHDGLADTVSDFCDRWNIGVEHLAKDGQEIVGRLNACVLAYAQVERTAQVAFDGMLRQSTGPDPGAG